MPPAASSIITQHPIPNTQIKSATVMGSNHDNMISTGPSEAEEKSHCCEVKVSFPTNVQAQHAMTVLAVDPEPTNRVTKHFQMLHENDENNRGKEYMVV